MAVLKFADDMLDLDILTMTFDQTGVKNFYHPFDMSKISNNFYKTYLRYKSQAEEIFQDNHQKMQLLKIVYQPIFFELYRLSYIKNIYLDLIKKDKKVLIPERYKYLKYFFDHNSIETNLGSKFAVRNAPHLNFIKWVPKLLRNIYLNRFNKVKRNTKICIEKYSTVSLLFSDLTNRYLKSQNMRAHYVDKVFWFNVDSYGMAMKNTSHKNFPGFFDIVSFFQEMINEFLADDDNKSFSYIRDSLILSYTNLLKIVVAYINYFSSEAARFLPKNLLVGSSSCILVRILSSCVQENGGKVIKFDHGAGRAFGRDALSQWQFEFEYADHFITFSEGSKNEYRNNLDFTLLSKKFNPKELVIESIIGDKQVIKQKNTKAVLNKNVKTIMYLGQVFPGEHLQLANSYSTTDIQYIDWLLRLLSMLSEWGYQVYYKPHPAERICIAPPQHIEKITGCRIINQRYEAVYNKCDLVIFDAICSSTLPTTTSLVRQFMYIDFSIVNLSKIASALLLEDGHLITGYFDDQNRAQVNWSELKNKLQVNKVNQHKFYEYYYC